MPRGVYDHSKRRKKNQPASTGKVSKVTVENEPVNIPGLQFQNGDAKLLRSVLEKRLAKANKKVGDIKRMLDQIPS